jgi:hypothetical protein
MVILIISHINNEAFIKNTKKNLVKFIRIKNNKYYLIFFLDFFR